VATKKTHIYEGLSTGKHYHGDLMGRAMYLLLALTGNWGKKGTGPTYWNSGPSTGVHLTEPRKRSGMEEVHELLGTVRQVLDAIRVEDPTRTDEIASAELAQRVSAMMGAHVPAAWLWYRHSGYRERWGNRNWHDPSMAREFDEYIKEALSKGWWMGVDLPREDRPPRVMIEVGGNLLRRTRGGQNMFLENLWPKVKTIVSVDVKMTKTGLHSDYVLPAAQQHERPHAHGYAGTMFFSLLEKATEPAGEALPEWQIFRRLSAKLAERGKARGFTEYKDWRGRTYHLDTLDG
jgi:anaerobic selenocysteine-containing dehydrogenase